MKLAIKAILISSTVLLFSCGRTADTVRIVAAPDKDSLTTATPEPASLFGIQLSKFDIDSGTIRKNSFLSDILLSHGVSMPDIDKILNNSKNVFDVRKVLPGRQYKILHDRDTLHKARYMIYSHDVATTYVFSLVDSMNITGFRKAQNTEIRYASGKIESSLWEAILDGGMHPQLAVGLHDIFAWTVDFFGLEKGDNFKVVYEEKFIEGKSMGVGKILTAQFTSSGKTYTAIPFIQDGKEAYYDVDGKSLKKAFLKAPLKFSRISSRYTTSRLHPVLKVRRPHLGVDYAAPIGTPVYSVGDGKVTAATYDRGSGRIVKIKHNSTYSTAYLHLSRFAPGITPGSSVRQGEVIGYVGSTGLSTGPHLDFRFYQNGSPIDPLRVIAPPAEPVTEANLDRFSKIKEVSISLLNTL